MRIPLLAAVLLALTACISSSGEGMAIGDKTLEQFKAGKTTENWVLAILGDPTSRSDVDGEEDTHVLRYTLAQQTGGFLGTVFGRKQVTVATVYFVVKGGLVTSFWADRQEAPGLFGADESAGEKQ